MPQFARPDSDVINSSNWIESSGSNYWSLLDEVTPDTADYVISVTNPSGTITFQVGLSAVTDPVSSTNHIIRINQRKDGGKSTTFTISLYQTATLIADFSFAATSTDQIVSYTLTAGEANNITDYSALRMTVQASISGGGSPTEAVVNQLEFEVPSVASSFQAAWASGSNQLIT